MKVYYKVWIEIEKCEMDEDGEESFFQCDVPEGIATRDTFEEAQKLQQQIINYFNEI